MTTQLMTRLLKNPTDNKNGHRLTLVVSRFLIIYFMLSLLYMSSAFKVYAHNFHTKGQVSATHNASHSQGKSSQVLASKLTFQSYVKYLGNEALFVHIANSKLLFDPFFHDNIRIYQLVPDTLKRDIFSGTAPFNAINLILISHAHRDHFAVDEVVSYLLSFTNTKLVGPKQAIDKINTQLKKLNKTISHERLISVNLNIGDQPWQQKIGEFLIDAVRIPHAGWPSRAEVENIVFRVTVNHAIDDTASQHTTVMHMGDADPDDDHYLPYRSFWRKKITEVNFPPYWFLYSAEGRDILDNIIGAKTNIGVHVPMAVPKQLQQSGREYFSIPGNIKPLHSQTPDK